MPRPRHVRPDSPGCPVEVALTVIGGKWKGTLILFMLDGTMRFNELRRRMPGVTQRILTKQLRELEQDGLVRRTAYPEVPPRVEYSLTPQGLALEVAILALKNWAEVNQTSAAAA